MNRETYRLTHAELVDLIGDSGVCPEFGPAALAVSALDSAVRELSVLVYAADEADGEAMAMALLQLRDRLQATSSIVTSLLVAERGDAPGVAVDGTVES